MEYKYNKGSEWRKWDLHFHTPSSYDYENKSVTNQQIIDSLLASNISAIAITDHHIIDVDRIKDLQNLAKDRITIFPGIECCSELGGSESIHFIGIFPENCDIETIWTKIQGKHNLTKGDILSKGEDKIICKFEETCQTIIELGGVISVHAGKKTNSIESIKNNLLVKREQKQELLSKFIDFLEIGKTEDESDYKTKVFPSIGFNLPVVICSDNHNVNIYDIKANLWIKADPTFEGLKQVINEPEDRVYIGDEPSLFKRVKNDRTKYVSSIKINPIAGYQGQQGKWFDKVEIELNKELIAIIGNKGSGKSAIADMIALCSNQENQADFSFLNDKKFRAKKLATNFDATIQFEDGAKYEKNLGDSSITNTNKFVKYLPQGFFDRLCNEISKVEEFKREIESVVFQYIDETDRSGASDFEMLIEQKKHNIDEDIDSILSETELLSKQLIELEKKQNPAYKKGIDDKIIHKKNEIAALIKPSAVANPNDDPAIAAAHKDIVAKISILNTEISALNSQIESFKEEKKRLISETQAIATIKSKLSQLVIQIDNIKQLYQVSDYGLSWEQIISAQIRVDLIEDQENARNKRIDAINVEIGQSPIPQGYSTIPIINQIANKQSELEQEQKNLTGPQQEYHKYIAELAEFEQKKKNLEGTPSNPSIGTLQWLTNELIYINNQLSKDISLKYDEIINKVREIYKRKKEVVAIYEKIKSKIDSKILEHKNLLEGFEITIEASLSISIDFKEHLLKFINKSVKGSFNGTVESEVYLKTILEDKDVNIEDNIVSIISEIRNSLMCDMRQGQKTANRNIEEQVSDLVSFYKYLFSLEYLEYNYQLKQNGKILEFLSPGEKGALLLVFYLLLDMDSRPLILDQPEDNLDNESVAKILVKFIKSAKSKRQIIMVTHNPNLAVVADAEQVIYVNIDKENKNTFSYASGSIENPIINKHIVDVLEGAMPAFNKRKIKYYETDSHR